MLQEERQRIILEQVGLYHKVLSSDLCKLLDVSLDTVRRDLAELERGGKIIKVHGGALAKSFHQPFQQPEVYAREAKQAIAAKALQLIQDGMILLAGGGTIMLELARMIPADLSGTLFTVSPLVALEVAQRSKINVILIAGQLAPNSYICTGSTVITQLSEIQADLCFLGTNGISVSRGLSEHDWEVMQVKKALIRASRRTAVLGISEKINVNHKLQICRLNSIDYFVTELQPDDARLADFAGVTKVI